MDCICIIYAHACLRALIVVTDFHFTATLLLPPSKPSSSLLRCLLLFLTRAHLLLFVCSLLSFLHSTPSPKVLLLHPSFAMLGLSSINDRITALEQTLSRSDEPLKALPGFPPIASSSISHIMT